MAEGTIPNNIKSWQKVLQVSTTSGEAYDVEHQVNFGNPEEIMMTLQLTSNLRTFASTVMPFGQFRGGAMYVMGSPYLGGGLLKNVVCIHTQNGCEIAMESQGESVIIRIFVR